MPKVAIVKGNKTDDMLSQLFNLLGGLEKIIPKGANILIKPNWGAPVPSKEGCTTNIELIKHLVMALTPFSENIIVGESSVCGIKASQVFSQLKINEEFKECEARLMSFDDEDKIVKKSVPEGTIFKTMNVFYTPHVWADVIIDVPVMKTHFITGASLGMKNLKGTIPDGTKKQMHRIGVKDQKYDNELDYSIVDLNRIIKPTLTIIDGITAMEGINPNKPGISGNPVQLNLLIGGFDVVAVDTVAVHCMGFSIDEVKHLQLAEKAGLGCANLNDIEIVGCKPSDVKHQFAPAKLGNLPLKVGGLNIFASKGCSGCRETLNIALSGIAKDEIAALGDMDVIIGYTGENRTKGNFKKMFVGNCAKLICDDNSIIIEGCPPPMFYIKEVLMVKRDGIL